MWKNEISYFFTNAEGLGEQKCQHICFANASHKWLSASLAVWGQHICFANASHKWLSASLAVWGQHICFANASHTWLSASLAVWGQHICFANASHKWLSASLAVWGSPTRIPKGKAEVSRLLSRWNSAPRRKRGRHRRLCKAKCLTQWLYTSVYSSKA